MQKLLALAAVAAFAKANAPTVAIPKPPSVVDEPATGLVITGPVDLCSGKCLRSCQFTGCNGCCAQSGAGDFLNKAINKGCCSTGLCACVEVAAAPLALNSHEHSYCHLDTTPKFGKKTIWKERKVEGTRPILVDEVKSMKKTVVDYKIEEVPSIKHGKKMVERTKTRTIPSQREITTTEKFTVKVPKPVTQMKDESYVDFETKFRPAVRRVKKIRMVPKTVASTVVEFETKTEEVPTSEWVTK